jgi:hypothetical protein
MKSALKKSERARGEVAEKKGLKRRSKVNKKLRMKLKVFFPPFRVLHKKNSSLFASHPPLSAAVAAALYNFNPADSFLSST